MCTTPSGFMKIAHSLDYLRQEETSLSFSNPVTSPGVFIK